MGVWRHAALRHNLPGHLLELVTFFVVSFTTIYYCSRGCAGSSVVCCGACAAGWQLRTVRRADADCPARALGFLFAISASIADMPRTVTMHWKRQKTRLMSAVRSLTILASSGRCRRKTYQGVLDDQTALLRHLCRERVSPVEQRIEERRRGWPHS